MPHAALEHDPAARVARTQPCEVRVQLLARQGIDLAAAARPARNPPQGREERAAVAGCRLRSLGLAERDPERTLCAPDNDDPCHVLESSLRLQPLIDLERRLKLPLAPQPAVVVDFVRLDRGRRRERDCHDEPE